MTIIPPAAPYPTYEEICTFCNEVAGRDNSFYDMGIATDRAGYILLESEHFVVVPCLGALTEWYVLVVPRRHVLSAGYLDAAERAELRILLDDVRDRLAGVAVQDVVVFEHGSFSFRDKGGACHDHAHIHLVATADPVSEFVTLVSEHIDLRSSENWIEDAARLVNDDQRSYLALESDAGSMIATARNAPSAFFRKALTQWLSIDPGEHDWLVFPQAQRLRRMIEVGLPARSQAAAEGTGDR
jgi:diadenosine tetraphosphate (Ap4A) HIT family hydrolase